MISHDFLTLHSDIYQDILNEFLTYKIYYFSLSILLCTVYTNQFGALGVMVCRVARLLLCYSISGYSSQDGVGVLMAA